MKKIILLTLACGVFFAENIFAQFPGCPAVSTASNVTIPCGQTCTNLTANAFAGAQTTAYSVTSIPYTPPFAFNTGTQILVNTDDIWSGVINLPFNFCFFGNTYSQIVVGSNGVCSFRVVNAGAFNSWNIPGPIPSATPADLTNSIMGPWQDIDPTNQGQVFYEIGGTAPCRYFKVSWYNVPYYGAANSVSTGSCPGQNLRATQQIVLYETTNVIDMYIQQKQTCAAWNSGRAIQGIQNAAGTVAYIVPGRNSPTQWTANNDAHRFTPSGAPNYTIAWFQGGTPIGTGSTINVCPPSATTYTAQATYTNCDGNQVVVSSDVSVGFSGVSINIDSIHEISCNGGSDGAVYASYNTGSAVISYGWSPGGAGQTHLDGIPAGTYIFSVTDAANCTRFDTVTLIDPPLLTVTVPDTTLTSCTGNPTTSLTATPAGGTPGYTYSWDTGPTTQTITGVGAGTYTVIVSDSKLCTATDAGTVTVVTSNVTFNQPVITDALCGQAIGSITVSVSGATAPVTFAWSNSLPNGDTQTGLAGGTYSVTATDANGCSATAAYTVGQTNAITFRTPVVLNETCAGNDGSITVDALGDTQPTVFTWSNGLPDGATQTGLASGTYTVTATDANGCSASTTITITQTPSFTFDAPVITDATCGGNDGSIVVIPNGALAPVDFTWSGGLPNNDTVTGLAAGTYSVTASDAAGCSASVSYTVGQGTSFSFGNPVITNASCANNDGSIIVTEIGATEPISYSWSGGLPDNDTVTGLASGTYNVSATDANGCTAAASYTVGVATSFTFGNPVITEANCNGTNGSLVVTVTGATDPISYSWSGGLPDNDTVTGLAVGTYSVTATDANGCTASATYDIDFGPSIIIDNAVVNDESCSGGGSINVTASGGTGTLTYSWSGGLNGNSITGLSAGTYTLTITDQGGCSITATYLVGTSPCGDCPAVSTNNNVTIPCGETCATLTATAIAGAQTTSYTGSAIAYNPAAAFNSGTPILVNIDDTWSGAIALPFNFCFFGNTYGQLYVGSNGVVGFNAPPIGNNNSWQINGPIPSATPNDLRNCIMGPWHDMDPSFQGSIYYSIIGTYPCRQFVVSWYQVPMYGDPNSSDLPPFSCTAQFETQQIVLYETTNVIDIYIQNKSTCAGWNNGLAIEGIQNATGTVAYTVPGRNATVWTAANDAYRFTPAGAPNYVINWFEGATQVGTGDSITVCPAATTTYTVQAVYTNCDNSTVTVSDSVFVTVQGGLTVTIDSVIDVSCAGGNDGAVYASYTSTGGAVTSFGWTPGGANQTSLTGIPAGTYVFTATNTSGCTISDTAIVTEPAQLVVNVPDTTLYNCTAGVILTSLTATVSGGTAGYTYDWGGGITTPTITGVGAGTYTVTVTDANACTATGNGTITQVLASPAFNQPVISNVTCFGFDNGSITVSVSQATPPVDYAWSGGLPNGSTQIDLDPGTYTVTATDANGCSVSASYDITEPAQINAGQPIVTEATCSVGGTITVFGSGGTGTLTYNWSNGDSGSFIDSLAAGPYDLTITDANGCTATASFTVNASLNTVAFGTPTIVDATCNGGNNGSITATATGGTGTITFLWSTGQTAAAITGLTAGSYCVTITDGVGCSASTCYTVNEPLAITFGNPIITPATCLEEGTVTVTAAGGTGTLTYSWSNGDTGSIADSIAGGSTVTLTVTDANQCSASASYTVPDQSNISFGNSIVTNITCNGNGNGSIHVVVISDITPVTYTWNPQVSTDSMATGLSAGTYTVTVSDIDFVCSATASFTITEPTVITLGNPVIVDATCSQGGSITASASGGTGTLNYAWSGPTGALNGNPITGLDGGTYSLAVTDANGCSATATYTVGGATGAITLGTPVINNVSCNGLNNGSITATATGTGNITYTWSTIPQQVGATATGLAPGSYTVTATTQGGNCSATATYSITEPSALSVTVDASSAICFNATNGTATAVVTGGTGTYTYEWNPAQSPSTNTANNLAVGIVLVTVTDANGCTATSSDIIGQSPSLSYNSQVNQPNCADLGFGTEILTPRGGTGAITVSIPGLNVSTTLTMVGADTVLTVPNVPTGNYTFTLTDALGCTATGNFFVNAGAANESFDVNTDSTTCYGEQFNDGAITVTPLAAANAPYTYSLNGGSFQADSAFNNLAAGTYTIVTRNVYGCLDTISAVVEQPARLVVDATPDTIVTGVGVSNQITVNTQNFTSNPVYVWSPVTGLSCDDCSNPTATVGATTVFYVVVNEESNKACLASDSVVIIVNGELKMPNAFTPNGDGKNDTYGPVNGGENSALTVTDFRIYNRWGQMVHNDIVNWDGKIGGKDQPAGTYIYYISVKTPDENNPGTDKVVNEQGSFTLLR